MEFERGFANRLRFVFDANVERLHALVVLARQLQCERAVNVLEGTFFFFLLFIYGMPASVNFTKTACADTIESRATKAAARPPPQQQPTPQAQATPEPQCAACACVSCAQERQFVRALMVSIFTSFCLCRTIFVDGVWFQYAEHLRRCPGHGCRLRSHHGRRRHGCRSRPRHESRRHGRRPHRGCRRRHGCRPRRGHRRRPHRGSTGHLLGLCICCRTMIVDGIWFE